MTKQFLSSLVLLLLFSSILTAQVPDNILLEGTLGRPSLERGLCGEAGTITFGTFTGQSNDVTPDSIFLCFGDELPIIHNGDAMFFDPDDSTTPGIGYVFYDCRPTESGPDIATILTDNCINNEDQNGNPQTDGIWIFTGSDPAGNITLVNDGSVQAAFNNGNPNTFQTFWFAPITVDNFSTQAFEVDDNGVAGSCVDVSTDQAFYVVYLSQIQISDINPSLNASGCDGSFVVSGGLPQMDLAESYDIDIFLSTNPTVRGTYSVTPNDGDEIPFHIPEPGLYTVNVTDGMGCGISFNIDMAGCQTVEFTLPIQNVPPASTTCMEITVEDFTDITAAQFSIHWDSTIILFNTIGLVNPNFADLGISNFFSPTTGTLNFSWSSGNPVSVPSGDFLFELCFDVIGDLGDVSAVTFDGNPIPVEVGDPPNLDLGVIVNDGIVIVSNDPLFRYIEQDSVTCPGDEDGSLTITVADGVAPYQYSWNTVPDNGNPPSLPMVIPASGESAVINNLAIGSYQITITDAEVPTPNMRVDTVEVFGPPSLGVAVVREPPSCVGESDGIAWAEVNLANVSYLWNIDSVNDTIYNLTAGFYEVVVTDDFGCSVVGSVTLFDPPAILIDEANSSMTPASCSGVGDGALTIAAMGGTSAAGTYSFHWEDADGTVLADATNTTSSSISMLEPGEYSVTITDDNGCSHVDVRTVGAAKELSMNGVITDVTCNGLFNGQVFVTGASSPSSDPPFTFSWSNVGGGSVSTNSPSSTLSGIGAGSYSVTMTDNSMAACQVTASFEVAQPEPLTVALLEVSNETCLVGSDGSATLGVSGGTAPYTYSWDEIPGLTDSIATDLTANLYHFNVTDANDCPNSLEVAISAPADPSIDEFNDTSVSCATSMDGALTVVASAGSSPIDSYTWSTGDTGNTFTDLNDLSPGMYIVTVTGEDFCTAIDTAFVTAPDPLVIDSITMELPLCPGFNNGLATVFVSGGTPGYTYVWSTDPDTPTTNPVLFGLEDGNYQVTVVDANDCPAISSDFLLPDPPAIEVTLSNDTAVTCPDDLTCDGGMTASAIYSDGSMGQFNFMWPSTEEDLAVATSTANQLCRGDGQILVVSDGECGENINIDVASPPDFNIGVEQEKPSCNGSSDGTITLTPTGGTGDFTFVWQGQSETSNVLSGITAGDYTAILVDENNCNYTQTVELGEPVALILEVDLGNSTPNVSCEGDEDGVITVEYNSTDDINPIGPNPFTWSGNVAPSSSPVATDLPAGTYSITLTDTKGCMDEASFTITEPAPIIFEITPPESPLCHGDQTQVFIESASGGTGQAPADYVFMIDNNGLTFPITIGTPIFAGEHTIAVLDPNGCQSDQTLTISEPAELIVSLPSTLVIELGDTLNRLNPIVSGGTQPYTSYQWTPSDFLSSDTILNPFINPTDNQDFEFTVVDANGCVESASIFVELDANRNIYIPNVFSPNGDGPNDEFRIFACRGVRAIKSAQVFDRWGGMVFNATDVPPACEGGSILWDGRVNGRLAEQGVYVYLIEVEFLDGVTLLYRGDIAVIR